jgi:hypothetical protein
MGREVSCESEEDSRVGYLYLLNENADELKRNEAAAIGRIWSDALLTVGRPGRA